MEAWISILHENQLFPSGYTREASATIMKTFLETRLAAPDGSRPRASVDEEEDDTEESDRSVSFHISLKDKFLPFFLIIDHLR